VSASAERFGEIYAQLDAELDWQLLGRCSCEGDGSEFFDDELRERILDTGLLVADDLAGKLPKRGPARSLYVGAAVAELAPMLVEQLVLGREVVWLNLDSAELRELDRALEAVSNRCAIELPRPASALQLAAASCDHVWIVSVLSDPEHFPALHDDLYGRAGSELATGRGDLREDRDRALALARHWLECCALPCILSSTDEELSLLAPLAASLGLALEVPERAQISAVVGDRIRHCSVLTRGRTVQDPA
jgi:hypothetical protein